VGPLSLLDMNGREHVHWYVIYMSEDNDEWWNKLLKPKFRHVQMWRPIQFGPTLYDRFWLVVDPGLEHCDTKIDHDPTAPWDRGIELTVQSVQTVVKRKQIREYFFFGPITCVEMVKIHLGIQSWRVRTPWQLYKYIRAHNHMLVLR